MSKIYVVELDWFDWETEESERENEHYFFASAEDALEFGKNMSCSEGAYNRHGRPMSAYLFSFEDGTGGVISDRRYDTAWLDLDKKVRW